MQRINIERLIEKLKYKYLFDKKTISFTKSKNKVNIDVSYDDIFSKSNFKKLITISKNFIDIYNNYGGESNIFTKIRLSFLKGILKQSKVCPYCGKVSLIYFGDISNVFDDDKKAKRTFDLDHFLPKSNRSNNKVSYPHLAINLYNLIPACKGCNFILNDIDTLQDTSKNKKLFHPYFGWIYKEGNEIEVENKTFDEEVTFYGNKENDIKNRKQVFTTHHGKFFRLGEIYLNDKETFNIFQFIYNKYTQIKDEYSRFKKDSKSVEEFVEYFLKNYYPEDEQEILKYSNGKLKKDLIENMKRILEEELESDN